MAVNVRSPMRGQAEAREHGCRLEQVAVGDQIVVKPGDRVPVDGEVISGASYLDEPMI